MVGFPIVDSHVHIFDPANLSYPEISQVESLRRAFLPADFRAACGEVDVGEIVFLEVAVADHQCIDEALWVQDQAKIDPRIKAIVANLPLEGGAAIESDLARLAEIPLVRGVRRLIQSQADPEFCLQPSFIEGVNLLPKYGFSFDICIYHPQFANTLAFARQCPDVAFVLDHIGKPGIKAGEMEPWHSHMRELAEMPNVMCKISGATTEADHDTWTEDDLRPYLDHAIRTFGFDRVMFGGDWPVATLATDYPRWVRTVENAVAGCSQTELQKLFRDNARSFYRFG